MRKLLPIVCALLALATLKTAHAVLIFSADLTGDQEVPPVTTAASGIASLALNDAQTQLEIDIQLFGLDLDGNQTADPDDDVVALHIHNAPVGENGPVVFGFINPNSDLDNDLAIDPVAGTVFSVWDLNEGNSTTLADQLPNLFSGALYLNAHTPVNPGGEVRGQIFRVPEPSTLGLAVLSLLGMSLKKRGRN